MESPSETSPANGYAEHYTVTPRELSVYLSDKMEYPGAIVNAGIRMEYFMPNSEYPGDETDPTWTSDDYDDWDGDGIPEQYQGWMDVPDTVRLVFLP